MDNIHGFALRVQGHRHDALPRAQDHLTGRIVRHATGDGHLLGRHSDQQREG